MPDYCQNAKNSSELLRILVMWIFASFVLYVGNQVTNFSFICAGMIQQIQQNQFAKENSLMMFLMKCSLKTVSR